MGTPSFDLDRFTVESVADVSASSKTWTKPAGARSFSVECAEAYYLHGGDRGAPYTASTVSPGATNRRPYDAAEESPIFPCAAMTNVKVTAQTGNLSRCSIIWFF